MSWYGGEDIEHYVYLNRLIGWDQYAVLTWTVFFCNTLVPQVFWFQGLRRSEAVLVVVSVLILIGMWLERYVIITTTLHRDSLPSSWGMFLPTKWDFLTYFGSLGMFFSAFLLFTRFLPMISMAEMRGLLPGAHGHEEGR